LRPVTATEAATKRILQTNPSLSYAEIGRLLGVSRQRICQIASSRRRQPRFCITCGECVRIHDKGITDTAYYAGYCSLCWPAEKERRRQNCYLTFICEQCGNEFLRKAGYVNQQKKTGLNTRWCSKHCQGMWLAHRREL